MNGGDPSVLDLAYRNIADRRPRHVLTYLRAAADGTAPLDDLVDYVVEQETNLSASARESVRIDLYHVHLPILADTGAVEFDSHTETVRHRNQASVETVLDGAVSADTGGCETGR